MGGSCCTRYKKSEQIYVKEIDKAIEGIENGYKKFFFEIEHMVQANKNFPGFYPEILSIKDTDSIYSVELENCFNGLTLADLLRNENVEYEYFHESYKNMMDVLFNKFFLKKESVIPNPTYIKDNYLERVKRRLKEIANLNIEKEYGFSNTLLEIDEKGFYLNDEYFPPISHYIDYISNDKTLLSLLEITFNTESHHDLIPSNILVNAEAPNKLNDSFKLIDPRGEGETGEENRHYMYDLGKMLLGIDTLDIFRIFNGKMEKRLYDYNSNKKNNGLYNFNLNFRVDDPVLKKYIKANELFWELIDRNSKDNKSILSKEENLELKLLFSQACMYHPDISCRIIFEKDEELAICMYLRGSMMMRKFMDYYYKVDPLRQVQNTQSTLWPSVKKVWS